MIVDEAFTIHALINKNLQYFKADKESEVWQNYLNYLDGIVINGLFNCVQCSLQYLLQNLDKDKVDLPPLLEIKLELQAPEVIFQPSLDPDIPNSFCQLVEELLDDMFNVASLVPRIAIHKGDDDYSQQVEEIAELLDIREDIVSRVTSAIEKAVEYRNSFDSYAYLWVDDRQEFMKQFLLYGHVLTADELELAGEDGVPESPPSLNQFKDQVDSYEKIYGELSQFKVSICMSGHLLIACVKKLCTAILYMLQ